MPATQTPPAFAPVSPAAVSQRVRSRLRAFHSGRTPGSIAQEIGSFIAIRDSLLADAEQAATPVTLDRAAVANNYVQDCLRPARSPYQDQHLAEEEAWMERRRCAAVDQRLAQLRQRFP